MEFYHHSTTVLAQDERRELLKAYGFSMPIAVMMQKPSLLNELELMNFCEELKSNTVDVMTAAVFAKRYEKRGITLDQMQFQCASDKGFTDILCDNSLRWPLVLLDDARGAYPGFPDNALTQLRADAKALQEFFNDGWRAPFKDKEPLPAQTVALLRTQIAAEVEDTQRPLHRMAAAIRSVQMPESQIGHRRDQAMVQLMKCINCLNQPQAQIRLAVYLDEMEKRAPELAAAREAKKATPHADLMKDPDWVSYINYRRPVQRDARSNY